LKFSVVIGPTSRTFVGAPVPDSGSLFYLPHHCGIMDFKRLAFLTQSTADIYDTPRTDGRRQDKESATFWQRSGRCPYPDPD